MGNKYQSTVMLPLSVVGYKNLDMLLSDLQEANDFLLQAAVRRPGSALSMPRISKVMDDFVKLNDVNILDQKKREDMIMEVQNLLESAPSLHISFSTDPPQTVIHAVLSWLRQKIHPLCLLNIGLQPNIGVGCIIRGNSTYFDLSLREQLFRNKSMILERLDLSVAKQGPSDHQVSSKLREVVNQ